MSNEAKVIADHRATFKAYYPNVVLPDDDGASMHASGAFYLAALDGKLTGTLTRKQPERNNTPKS